MVFPNVHSAQKLPLYADSIELADSIPPSSKSLKLYRDKGESVEITSDYALHYLAIAEKISLEYCNGKDFLSIKTQRGARWASMGKAMESLQEYSEGIPYLSLKDSLTYRDQEGWFFLEYGNLLYLIELYSEAESVYREALKAFEDVASVTGISLCKINLGLCKLKQKQSQQALGYFFDAYLLRTKMNKPGLVAHALLFRAQAQLELGNKAIADSLLNEAERIIMLYEIEEFEEQILLKWAELAGLIGNHAKCRSLLRKAYLINPLNQNFNFHQKMAASFFNTGPSDSLTFHAQLALQKARKMGNYKVQTELLLMLLQDAQKNHNRALIEKHLSDFRNTYKLHLQQITLVFRKLMQTQESLRDERQTVKKLAQKSESKDDIISNQRRSIYIGLGIVLLMLLATMVIFRLYLKLSKTKNRLANLGQRVIQAGKTMGIAILFINKKGELEYFNHKAQELYKNPKRRKLQVRKNFCAQISNAELRAKWEKSIAQAPERSTWQEVSVRHTKKGKRHFMLSFSSMYNKGQYQGLIAIISEISDEYERNTALVQKTKDLEIANRSKERIISLLTHDLKEGILSPLELLQMIETEKNNLSKEQIDEYHALMIQSLNKTKNLLFKTLEWIKDQGNQFSLNFKNFYLDKLLLDLQQQMQNKLKQKGCRLEINVDKELSVYADPEVMHTVLRNLISNAVKFSPPQRGIVKIWSENLENNNLRIYISDNGEGMNSQEMENILSRKVNKPKQGTDGEQGSGMGLRMTQDLLNLHGSSLQIQSAVGQGSVFQFEIARHKL